MDQKYQQNILRELEGKQELAPDSQQFVKQSNW